MFKMSAIPWEIPVTLALLVLLIVIGIVSSGYVVSWSNSELKVVRKNQATPTAAMFAQAICHNSLSVAQNRSSIVLPLDSSTSNLESQCNEIGDDWHARGLIKGTYVDHDCEQPIENRLYDGNYVSFVSVGYFEDNRSRFRNCGPSNAFVCCSPHQ